MNTMPTGDAASIRETLNQITRITARHAGDAAAWRRWGGLLRVQRTLIGYSNRRRFIAERCRPGEPGALNYHYVDELEGGIDGSKRQGYPPARFPQIAEAYGVTLRSLGEALDGGQLVSGPVHGPGPAPPAGVVRLPQALPAPDREVQAQVDRGQNIARLSGRLSDDALRAAIPHLTQILMDLRNMAVGGIARPSGYQLFPDSDDEAAVWDRHQDEMPDEGLAMLIASRRVLDEAGLDSSVG